MSNSVIVTFVSLLIYFFRAPVGVIPHYRSDTVNLPTIWSVPLSNQHTFSRFKHGWQKSVWAGWKDAPLSNHGTYLSR